MKYFLHISIFSLLNIFAYSTSCKLVCYYDISGASKAGPAKFTANDMKLALKFCTHVIYSYVTVTPAEFTITALTPEREHELASVRYFKEKYPHVKFLLSLSGENNWKTTKTFLKLLEAEYQQKKIFIKDLMKILIKYKFDGLSLDLPLPREKPLTQQAFYSKMWFNFKKIFQKNTGQDNKPNAHKNQLTNFIQQLSAHIKEQQGLLSLNVLPNIDSSKYYDAAEIIKNLDFVVLSAFDFYTPQTSPNQADLMSPKKPDGLSNKRLPLTNTKSLYKYWHAQDVPRFKIIVGIAAFGRAWKMTVNSNSDGVPPVLYTDGPAAGGPQTQLAGILSWPEICYKLSHDPKLTRVLDAKLKSEVYAYRPADSRGNFGIWISYEDPITAGVKATYVRNHNLGGVALFDLTLDDVHGECSGEKLPILRSIKFKLTRFQS